MKYFLRRASGALLAAFLILLPTPVALGALSRPAVEKNPSPEAVNEWESTVFIARAAGCESYSWRIVSAGGETLYAASAAPEFFLGLRVEGAESDTLMLLNIPYALNGWCVECLFTDAAGEKALSGRAALTVYPVGPTPSPEPTPTPDATAAPETSPTPDVTATPETSPTPDVTPEPTASPAPEPTAVPTPAPKAPLSRRAVLGTFAGIVALALLLGAAALALRGGAHTTRRGR